MPGIRLGLGLGAGGRPPPAWTPLDLGASLLALFRASSPGTSPVATWPDEAPVPHDLTQATAAWRPTLDTIGSSPAVKFDGTNDFLSNSDTLTPGSGKFTLAVAYQLTAVPTGSFGGLCDFKLNLGTLDVLVMDLGGYKDLSFLVGAGTMVGADVGLDTSAHRLILRYLGGGVGTPANWRIDFDGVSATPVASGASSGPTGTALGSRSGGVNFLPVEIAGAALIDDVGAPTVALLDTWLQGLIA